MQTAPHRPVHRSVVECGGQVYVMCEAGKANKLAHIKAANPATNIGS